MVPFFLLGCSKIEKTEEVATETNRSDVVYITEFFDFGCGYCKKAANMLTKIEAKYGDKVVVEQRHFPLSPRTFGIAEASECARKQGKFRAFHDALFGNFGRYEEENIMGTARDLGLNEEEFKTCWKSGAMKTKVLKDQKMAQALGATGTPFFLINEDVKIPGMPGEAAISGMIDKLLDL